MTVFGNSLRVFLEGFAARDLAEPLASLDLGTGPAEALALMGRRDFDVIGVRQDGVVVGYVERTDLTGGQSGFCPRPFDPAAVVADSAPLNDVVHGLARSPRLFVTALGAVAGIITVPDLQKPPMRMWLFGIVTIVEMRTTQLIDAHCPDGSWQEYVSPGRLQKAEELLAERRRRGQNPRLLDCLQFADKGQIVARNEEIRKQTLFTSRRQIEEAVKSLESLRNNLAHSQDIVSSDWEMIVNLAENLERVVGQRPSSPPPAVDASSAALSGSDIS